MNTKKNEFRREITGITREQACEIAAQYLQQKSWGNFKVNKVLAWDEINFRKPCIYYVRPFDIEKCWIAYLDGPWTGLALKSSDIAIISRDSGEVVYAGTASDEG